MSQRAIQTTVAQFLDCDDHRPDEPTINHQEEQTGDESLKYRNPADLEATVFLGTECYHSSRGPGIPGCPHARYNLTEGTIEDAIDEELTPCKSCHPPDYRVQPTHPLAGDEDAIPLPDERPDTPSDLDPIVSSARGNTSQTAHIPACRGDEPQSLCSATGRYQGGGEQLCKPASVWADPDDWLSICGHCQAEFDRLEPQG
ncbi:hypothetical protein [Halocatena halophila]|uniref:hypothetical protein n=1 Tax=Halocatena halophila TaxID=2814576 RepID=UPI002ED1601D